MNSKTKVRSGIPPLSVTGNESDTEVTDDNKEKAELLAKHFSSVFTKEPDGLWDLPGPVQINQKVTLDLGQDIVHKALCKLNISKSPGPDGVHPRLLYELRDVLCKPLSLIFKSSMESGVVPSEWKKANITAIYKKGSKKLAGNYRPVSLTSVVCKLMESIIRDSIMEHMSKNNLLNSQQYGFVSGRSTVLQLIKVMDRWTEILDKGGCIDVVYCDFLKAFDKVPHKRLVQKLNYYGIAPVLVNWIKEFLSDRKQKVMVNGECSTWYEVTSGIPQGSVLGPTLFVMYINSLPDVISQSSSYLFADDTKLANGIFENSDCEALQSDLNNMVEWTEKSLLKFHPDKCVHMTIGKSKLDERTYTLGHNGPVIRKVKEEKDIGIIFDAELKFSSHISEKVNKANSIMGLVRRTFTHLDKGNFALLFKSLVRPHLEFANQVWSPYLQKHIQEIENVQRRATKLIPGMKDLTYEERLETLNLPTLKYRRFRGDMIEMYKLLNSKYNTTVSDFIEINEKSELCIPSPWYLLSSPPPTKEVTCHVTTHAHPFSRVICNIN